MGPDFMALIGAAGILSSPDPSGLAFDLDNLDQHNFPIEHDVSLSRQDKYFGNWYDFNQTVWDGTVGYYKGMQKTTTPVAAKARYHRVEVCQSKNPECTYGPMQFIFSSGETGLYVQTMSDPVTNSAPVAYVRSLFEKEKLPYELGWRPSKLPITLVSLGAYVLELFAANPDRVVEGKGESMFFGESYVSEALTKNTDILQDSYASGLAALVGGADALRNLTSGISDSLHIPGL